MVGPLWGGQLVNRFGLAVTKALQAGKADDVGSIPRFGWATFLFQNGGLWTLSRDFAPCD